MIGYSLFQILWITLAVSAGAFVQGACGFAFAIVAVPILIWAGIPLQTAVVLSGLATLLQSASACYQVREHLPWREALGMFPARLLGMPTGVFVLERYVAGHEDRAKQVVGLAVLVGLVLLGAFRPRHRERFPASITYAAGTASGFLNGLVGMGGPPVVLYLTALDWPNLRTRGFIWLSFLLIAPFQIGLMVWRFPSHAPAAAMLGLLISPLVLVFATLGLNVGSRLDQRQLRIAMFSVLAVIAAISIAAPALSR